MNNIDLNTITVAEAKEAGITGVDLFTVVRNPVNSAVTKKNEEFAANLPSKTVKRKAASDRRDVNKVIYWLKGEYHKQVWIKADELESFKASNPEVNVTPFNNESHSNVRSNSLPYIGGGVVRNIKEIEFDNMVSEMGTVGITSNEGYKFVKR